MWHATPSWNKPMIRFPAHHWTQTQLSCCSQLLITFRFERVITLHIILCFVLCTCCYDFIRSNFVYSIWTSCLYNVVWVGFIFCIDSLNFGLLLLFVRVSPCKYIVWSCKLDILNTVEALLYLFLLRYDVESSNSVSLLNTYWAHISVVWNYFWLCIDGEIL